MLNRIADVLSYLYILIFLVGCSSLSTTLECSVEKVETIEEGFGVSLAGFDIQCDEVSRYAAKKDEPVEKSEGVQERCDEDASVQR